MITENKIKDDETESRALDKKQMNLTGMSENLLNSSIGSFNDYKVKNKLGKKKNKAKDREVYQDDRLSISNFNDTST